MTSRAAGPRVTHRRRPDFLTAGLAWVQVLGVGVEQFPLDELAARGVPLCNARGVAAGSVAEHAFALLLAMTRRLPELQADRAAHHWVPRIGSELAGSTLGVLGLGAIGQQVARRADAFDMTVLGVRRRPGPVRHVHEVVGLDELFARAKAVVVCLPGGAGTRGMVGAPQLAALGDGWLVNVGRGGVVDEPALLDALHAGTLRGAALDVVDTEPGGAGPCRRRGPDRGSPGVLRALMFCARPARWSRPLRTPRRGCRRRPGPSRRRCRRS